MPDGRCTIHFSIPSSSFRHDWFYSTIVNDMLPTYFPEVASRVYRPEVRGLGCTAVSFSDGSFTSELPTRRILSGMKQRQEVVHCACRLESTSFNSCIQNVWFRARQICIVPTVFSAGCIQLMTRSICGRVLLRSKLSRPRNLSALLQYRVVSPGRVGMPAALSKHEMRVALPMVLIWIMLWKETRLRTRGMPLTLSLH